MDEGTEQTVLLIRSFSVCSRMLHMFYKSVVESSILSASSVEGAASEPVKLNKLIKKAGSVLGTIL